jgi:hypothetical protein
VSAIAATGPPGRLVFFFDSPGDVVVFDEPLMPMGATVLEGEG